MSERRAFNLKFSNEDSEFAHEMVELLMEADTEDKLHHIVWMCVIRGAVVRDRSLQGDDVDGD